LELKTKIEQLLLYKNGCSFIYIKNNKMKNTIYTLFIFICFIIFLTSCDPNYCADYVIQNDLDQDVEIVFYTNSKYIGVGDSITRLQIASQERNRVEIKCGMSGSYPKLDLLANDSIHIILEDGSILKYTNNQPKNNIYDTRNRDIWIEEYGKETRWKGGDYRFVFTIDESTIEE
jgi:hypothetical protein